MPIPNSQGNNDTKAPASSTSEGSLISWIVPRVRRARIKRDSLYGERWKEYTRIWRGMWGEQDKNRDSERSKLISPALQQAIEMTVAEMEEAVFSKTAWFDVEDDLQDEVKEDALAYRDQLLEDFYFANVEHSISEVFLLGAIYGTGIGKINVQKRGVPQLIGREYKDVQRIVVTLESVRPDEFFIDPAATTIESALFCGHDIVVPMHKIKDKQKSGVYKNTSLSAWSGTKGDSTGTGRSSFIAPEDEAVLITEYFGKVPRSALEDAPKDGEPLVEAIVTVANEEVVLRAVPVPFLMKDRPFIAYQHDTVPGEFWGRGVSEKGYNPQKALDSELRARIDSLAYLTAPMLGVDLTRLPNNPDLRVRPGRMFGTRGRPSEIIEPVGFQANLNATFQQSGDLERMVQMGTGAMDSATPLGVSRRNETMGGMSMMQSGFVKRSNRTMQNVERMFLGPLVTKSLWRYMQFDPQRYPKDMKFVVRAAMGIMAKEVENQQLVTMLGFTPPDSPGHLVVLKALFENTTSSKKKELLAAIEAVSSPPSEEDQQMAKMQKQMALQAQQEELRKFKLENDLIDAQIKLTLAKAKHEVVNTDLEDDLVQIQATNAATAVAKTKQLERQTDVAAQRNVIEAHRARTQAQTKRGSE